MDLDFKPLLAKADGTLPDLYLAQHSWDGSGHILVGGDFASVNGVARSGIVRLNSNGTLDTGFTFNPASMPGLTNIMVTHTDDDTGGPLRVFGKATISRRHLWLYGPSAPRRQPGYQLRQRSESGASRRHL